MKAIIIDDEKDALVTCTKKIELYCPEINVLEACQGAKDGLKAIKNHNPDLIFLDIEMPWMNGFELLECLEDDYKFQVIFVTAYDQYAIQAFKVNATDYLLKPFSKHDLIECVNKIRERNPQLTKSKVRQIQDDINKPQNSNRLLINTSDGIQIIKQEEIMYCQASSNYTYINSTGDKKLLTSKTLSEIESKLNQDQFARTHKSYLVNLTYVSSYSNEDGGLLILNNGNTIPISRRRKEQVLNAIANL